MSARHPTPWAWEEHGLSKGVACIVYDASGRRVGGLDFLDRETAAAIVAGVNALPLAVAALREIAGECTTMGPELTADAVLARIKTLLPEIDA